MYFPLLYLSFSDEISISSSPLLRVEHYLLLPHTINPLDMLGGLAKANIWVARPRGPKSSLFVPLDMLRGLAKKPT
jgi:hypothetical protein